MFNNKEDVSRWLDLFWIKNYTIHDDLSVDVDDNVYLLGRNLEYLPIQFGTVTGYFDCSYNQLTSLKNCPHFVGLDFNCDSNKLRDIQYIPQFVGRNIYVDHDFDDYHNLTSKFNGDFIHETYGQPLELFSHLYHPTENGTEKLIISYNEFHRVLLKKKLDIEVLKSSLKNTIIKV